MAHYNDSISDSYSLDKNIPSAESVSYNGRDYTPEFTTDEIFQSRDDMLAWVRMVGRNNGIVLVIKNSTNLKGNRLPRLVLSCERGGKYKQPRYLLEGESLQRNTGTKKCDCPFEVRGVPLPPDGVMWGVKVSCGFHNHEPAEYLDGHEYPSRLKPEEKKIVIDMANSTAPREILSILKERDSTNTTGIKSIYNAILENKSTKRGGLNAIQYVLSQLIKKGYLHEYLTNSYTNEITDILWVHLMSLQLYVNFPIVLIVDATYKTNEYRIPLLEVVGITSTMRTYSLMFAYLSNERAERLTWALGSLKKMMGKKGGVLPTVFVSDRDLALLKAIEACFPTARHILCIWHINQNIMKNCSPMLGPLWNSFSVSWHSLIISSTVSAYKQKWHAMCEEFSSYPNVIEYLWITWLMPYKERFLSTWIDTCMHLGSNSSQRAESAHAILKLYLGGTMSSLQISFDKIHKMLKNQFGGLKKSFEKSMNIPRHKHLHDDIFNEVRCRISLEAMEFIYHQLEYASSADPTIAGNCDCAIKITHGLPCVHDLAFYISIPIPIPLGNIHSHWSTLSMHTHELTEDGSEQDKTFQVFERLQEMDPVMREHMIDKFIDITDPSHTTIRAPAYNTEHKGRPTGKDEQSKRRIPSFLDACTSRSKGATSQVRGKGKRVEESVQSEINTYIQQLPEAYRHYITHTIDVKADGHCGFRAIAALVGYGEDGWGQVRTDLIEEIQQYKDLYDVIYPSTGWANCLLDSLCWFHPTAPTSHWMDCMSLGVVIASRYNLVLHTFDEIASNCFTHLPLRSPPVSVKEHREIAIARVRQHFVQVFLHPHYPVPPIPMWWLQYASIEARGWADSYALRINLWYEVMGGRPSASGNEFEGCID